jgi:hypothetical protein
VPSDATRVTPETPYQHNLFNSLHEIPYPIATSRRKPVKRNPYNGTWLKAYVDALINNRAVHLTMR